MRRLPISAKGLPWQKAISLSDYGSMSDSAILHQPDPSTGSGTRESQFLKMPIHEHKPTFEDIRNAQCSYMLRVCSFYSELFCRLLSLCLI